MTVDDYTSLSSPDDMTSVLTVSQITAQVKSVLDGTFQSVLVEGEISNFLHHSSGHMYFTLKDDKAELRAVMFQGDNSRLKFVLRENESLSPWQGYSLRGSRCLPDYH